MSLKKLFVISLILAINYVTFGQSCKVDFANKLISLAIDDKYKIDTTKNIDNPFSFGTKTEVEENYSKRLIQDSTKIINTNYLSKKLPGFCFFKFAIRSNSLCFGNIYSLLAIDNNNLTNSKIVLDPTYNGFNDKFMHLFYGLKVDKSEKVVLSKEILKLICEAIPTFDCRQTISSDANIISFVIFQGYCSYSEFEFHFNNDALEKVLLISRRKKYELE